MKTNIRKAGQDMAGTSIDINFKLISKSAREIALIG